MSEEREPDLDQVREAMREHDERQEEDEGAREEPSEPPEDDDEAS
jgi:hypothetical protein